MTNAVEILTVLPTRFCAQYSGAGAKCSREADGSALNGHFRGSFPRRVDSVQAWAASQEQQLRD